MGAGGSVKRNAKSLWGKRGHVKTSRGKEPNFMEGKR